MSFCENESVKLDYVNDQLTKEARRAFDRHLTTCAACRHDVADMRVMASAVSRIPRPTPTRELVEQTRRRLAQTTNHRPPNHLLWKAFPAGNIHLVPSILASVLIAVVLTALFTVFHDYVAVVLQKTIELSANQLLWGTDPGGSSAPLTIPIAMILFILALVLIPSLFENTRTLRFRLSPDGRDAER
jgi:hypothetical protein